MSYSRNIEIELLDAPDAEGLSSDLRTPGLGETPIARRPFRILHSVGHLSRGGVETWLYHITQKLDRGYDHHVMVWTAEEEAFTAEFRSAGIQVHALPSQRNPARFAMDFLRLVRRAGPFDAVHTHGTQFHGLVLALARLAGIRRRIAHSHTDITPVLGRSSRLYRAYAAAGHMLIRRFATAGRGVSDRAAASMFGTHWQADSRWGLLFCGIDLDRFTHVATPPQREALGIPPGRFVIGHVGRFEAQKNHPFLLDILSAAIRQNADLHLLMIGDGALRSAIEAEIASRGLSDRVTLIPDCRDVPGLMVDIMDAFALPSLYEGLPLVVLEAQAAGLPCLIADSITEQATIIPALMCRLSLTAGADAWAEALVALPRRLSPRDPLLQNQLRSSAFSLDHSAEAVAALYALDPAA